MAQHYRCNVCKKEFPSKEIQVDHIKPVVDPKVGFKDWNTYIKRMFCSEKNLQAVCKPCHKEKTKKEKNNEN